MHGPQGACLNAPRVAPARILAAELLRPRAEVHMLVRILHQLRVLMISIRAQCRTHQPRSVKGRGEVNEG